MIHSSVKIGQYCIIAEDAIIGEGTEIKSFVEIRPGTVIGKNCYIDSGVKFSGNSTIGDNVTLRYDSIIARGVVIKNNTYVCPRVMTNNLDEGKQQIGGATIGENCFIGTNTVIQHGVEICDNVITGSMSFINKDIKESGTYIGIPAKKIK